MMREEICQMIRHSLAQLQTQGIHLDGIKPQVSMQKERKHGDYTSNTALIAAKRSTLQPQELAQKIINHLPQRAMFERIEVAGPGFINFYLKATDAFAVVREILQRGEHFYHALRTQTPQKVLIEYVSANPTGPLHVGHGRGAAYGESLAHILSEMGHQVEREYYINDQGRQIDILSLSVWLRYLELGGVLPQQFVYPSNLYQGDYIFDIAADVRNQHQQAFEQADIAHIVQLLSDADAEAATDQLIAYARTTLSDAYNTIYDIALTAMLHSIRSDLEHFGVHYEHWFSERLLVREGKLEAMLQRLMQNNAVYDKEGALWFRSSDYGDDKDRVIRRRNGQYTYFASDIAYHIDKYQRGYDRMINIWGADHHGYVPRLKAAIQASGLDAKRLHIILVQFAHLYRGEEKMPMSTRSGEFVRLRELCEEVGCDAARFLYVTQKPKQHIKFDLELAKATSMDNPVYYVQYAHARIYSVFKQLAEQGLTFDEKTAMDAHYERLDKKEEQDLIQYLRGATLALSQACEQDNPQLLVNYLRELAAKFHSYYSRYKFIVADEDLRNARLALLIAIRLVLARALKLIGVQAPQAM